MLVIKVLFIKKLLIINIFLWQIMILQLKGFFDLSGNPLLILEGIISYQRNLD